MTSVNWHFSGWLDWLVATRNLVLFQTACWRIEKNIYIGLISDKKGISRIADLCEI